MAGFLGQNINNGLYFIYGLVALVVILIIVIVVLDRKETKRRKQNEKLLSNTLNFKPIKDDSYIDKNIDDIEVVELKQKESKIHELNMEPEEEIEEIPTREPYQEQLELQFEEENKQEENYDNEIDLEKTQAQIRVEEITKALEKAVAEEKKEQQDKYMAFEEEQEKNAIISYKELKQSYDKLYEENEKIQYIDDDNIPINLNELYEYNRTKQEPQIQAPKEEVPEIKIEEPKKVKLNDFNEGQHVFKRSPYISPVYGIQKAVDTNTDNEIKDASNFLKDLKELRDNLE